MANPADPPTQSETDPMADSEPEAPRANGSHEAMASRDDEVAPASAANGHGSATSETDRTADEERPAEAGSRGVGLLVLLLIVSVSLNVYLYVAQGELRAEVGTLEGQVAASTGDAEAAGARLERVREAVVDLQSQMDALAELAGEASIPEPKVEPLLRSAPTDAPGTLGASPPGSAPGGAAEAAASTPGETGSADDPATGFCADQPWARKMRDRLNGFNDWVRGLFGG